MPGPRDVTRLPSSLIIGGKKKDPEVIAAMTSITAMCPCGSRKPLAIPLIPGAGGCCQCENCQTLWFAEELHVTDPPTPSDTNVPRVAPTVRVVFRGVIPAIARV